MTENTITTSASDNADAPSCKDLPPIEAISGAVDLSDAGPAPAPADIVAADLPSKYVAWPSRYNTGDCAIEHMTLRLWPDGRANFFAHAKSSDSDDVWVFYDGIAILDGHGVELWRSGKLVGPPMIWEGQWVTWNQNFFFPAYLYDHFGGARIPRMHC
jgi:hypothetical protein